MSQFSVEHVLYKQDEDRVHKALAFNRREVEGKEVVSVAFLKPEQAHLLLTGHAEDALSIVRDVPVEMVMEVPTIDTPKSEPGVLAMLDAAGPAPEEPPAQKSEDPA